MAFRLMSGSKQAYPYLDFPLCPFSLCASRDLLQEKYAATIRCYAKEAAPKGDEMLKNVFPDLKEKYDMAIEILRKEKITIAPEDPAAVAQYAKVMKTVREKAGLLSESQRVQETIETETRDISDACSYLLQLKVIRERGSDDGGIGERNQATFLEER